MYVVRSISQLNDAVRERAHEVMIVGALAPKILEIKKGLSEHEFTRDFSFTTLFNKFDTHEVRDRNQNIIATVFQQRN